MASIYKIKESELIGGVSNDDLYPVTSTQAVYSQGSDGSRPYGVAKILEDRLQEGEQSLNNLSDKTYRKSETYNRQEIDNRINTVRTGLFVIVDDLPDASVDTLGKIYLVQGTGDTKQEYITVNNGTPEHPDYDWENIGSTSIDLDDYSTTEEMEAALDALRDELLEDITNLGNAVYTKDEVYNKAEITEQFNNVAQFKPEWAPYGQLPEANEATMNRLFLKMKESSEEGNIADEYITVRVAEGPYGPIGSMEGEELQNVNDVHYVYKWERLGDASSQNTFVINTIKYSITEGSMTKDNEGHYSSSQYDAMYNNYLGFNQAFKDARDAGVSKVIVPKGIYCFCPIQTTVNCSQILQIYEANNIEFDFSGSTFRLCFDSTQRSQYHTYGSSTIYSFNAHLLAVATSTNVVIENLVMVGDRTERSYINSSEKNQEGTYGITIGIASDNIEVKNCDLSGFMGDGIGHVGFYQISRSEGEILNNSRKDPSTFTNYGYYYRYNGTSVEKATSGSKDFYTISTLIDCNAVYTSAFKQASKMAAKLAEDKVFSVWHNSGYSHSIDCARTVEILTYETSDQEIPSRIIVVEQLSNFRLIGNERYIRVQCHDEVDTPNPVDGQDPSTTTHLMMITHAHQDRVTIRNCYIHDNHRGGLSNLEGDVLIRDNVFEKTYTDNPPIFTVANTNYHIDLEDVNGGYYVITRNKFISNGSVVGQLLFPFSPKRLVFTDNYCSKSISIGRHYEAIIANNYFGGGVGVGNFISEGGSFDVNGGKTLRRHVEIYNNTLHGLSVSGTYLTDTKIHHNTFNISSTNLGKIGSQFSGIIPDVELSDNIIHLTKGTMSSIIPYKGKNNVITSSENIDVIIPFFDDTDIKDAKITLVDDSAFTKDLIYKNFKTTAANNNYRTAIYNNTEFRDCTFDYPLTNYFNVSRDNTITFTNCVFNSTLVGSENQVFFSITDKVKLRFVGCIFNVDALVSRFATSKLTKVTIEAIDCKAGTKEDTTSYQAMLTNSNMVVAYKKTLVSSSSGTSAERPKFPPLHYQYFDTTLGYPIYANAIDDTTGDVTWVDGAGNEV